jgi:hypothetical protein
MYTHSGIPTHAEEGQYFQYNENGEEKYGYETTYDGKRSPYTRTRGPFTSYRSGSYLTQENTKRYPSPPTPYPSTHMTKPIQEITPVSALLIPNTHMTDLIQ